MRATVRGMAASVAAWLAGAAVAIAVGELALSRIDQGLAVSSLRPGPAVQPAVSSPVVEPAPDLVTDEPEATPSRSPTPRPTPSATRTKPPIRSPTQNPPVEPHEEAFYTAGGAAVVRCTGNRAYLVSWSPRVGFEVEGVRRGPAIEVSLVFESEVRGVRLSARCYGGIPQADVRDIASGDDEEPED